MGGMLHKLSLIVTLLMALFPAISEAGMTTLADRELQEVFSQGFSSFTLVDGVARAEFNIDARTWTEIGSLKLGYYNDGATTGWDQDWTGVSLGSVDEDLVIKGIYIEAVFENIGNSATRSLKSVKFGTDGKSGTAGMTGSITATFTRFSGDIGSSTIDGHRLSTPFTSISFTNTGWYVSLNVDGTQKGWWVHWDNATTSGP